jgi:hypothetical protein
MKAMIGRLLLSIAILISVLVLAACARYDSPVSEKAVKSSKSGDATITLSSASGELKKGENDVTLSFTDASGSPIDIAAASLKFHMPAMGAMAEMNDVASLTTTETPGKFRAVVNIEVAGSWEAIISFQGSRGTEQASMSVTAK